VELVLEEELGNTASTSERNISTVTVYSLVLLIENKPIPPGSRSKDPKSYIVSPNITSIVFSLAKLVDMIVLSKPP